MEIDIHLKKNEEFQRCLNAMIFLMKVQYLSVVNFDLVIRSLMRSLIDIFVNIIKSQPLKSISMCILKIREREKIIRALEFRTKTLKDLQLYNLNFQGIDLSFISKLECLEHLGFTYCVGFEGFVSQNCFGKKFHLSICHKFEPDVVKTVISSFGGKSLYKLTNY